MEVKRFIKLHPFKNLSLKWSFVLYVVVCMLMALAISLILSGFFGKQQSDIQNYYRELYHDVYSEESSLVLKNGKVIQEGIWIYTDDISKKFSDKDSFLYNLYGMLSIFIVPAVFVFFVLMAAVIFYARKLKVPLAVLDFASIRIAEGDLDFKIQYDSRNELGRLASSFEKMRSSLHDTNRQMWRMMEGRKRLNAAFAHDLRTPLTVLRGYCDLLLKYVPEGKINSEKAVSTLSTMDVYLKRLEGYTSTMSSLQKLEEIELSNTQVSFNQLCTHLKNLARMLSDDKKFEFISDGDGFIEADIEVISQVCENLVSNAKRYANYEIKMACVLKNDTLKISVTDDGSGFSAEALKNAADPYFRDEKDISDASHFGIGLYICRLLCEKHGGSLLIENAVGGKVSAIFVSLADKK